jgi:proline iminopeptidase
MPDGELLSPSNIAKIKHLPISIVQGRYDVVCPAVTSWNLYQALGGEKNEKVTYKILGDSGHSAHEIGIEEQLMQFADAFKTLDK